MEYLNFFNFIKHVLTLPAFAFLYKDIATHVDLLNQSGESNQTFKSNYHTIKGNIMNIILVKNSLIFSQSGCHWCGGTWSATRSPSTCALARCLCSQQSAPRSPSLSSSPCASSSAWSYRSSTSRIRSLCGTGSAQLWSSLARSCSRISFRNQLTTSRPRRSSSRKKSNKLLKLLKTN